MIEKAEQHVLEAFVDFPIVRSQAEIAAETARLVEARRQLLERGRRNQAVAAELGVALVAQRMRVDETIRSGPRRRAAKPLDATPVRKRASVPRAIRRPERQERSEHVQPRETH